MKIWIPKITDNSLYVTYKDGNEADWYAVGIIIYEQTGEHIPRNLSKILKLFLLLKTVSLSLKSLESV